MLQKHLRMLRKSFRKLTGRFPELPGPLRMLQKRLRMLRKSFLKLPEPLRKLPEPFRKLTETSGAPAGTGESLASGSLGSIHGASNLPRSPPYTPEIHAESGPLHGPEGRTPMKKQRQLRTLKLHRETLRHLETDRLARAAGGVTQLATCQATCESCVATCQDTCYNSCLEYNTCFCGPTG